MAGITDDNMDTQDKEEPQGENDAFQSLMNPANPNNPENISASESMANVVSSGHPYWAGKFLNEK